MNTGGAIAPIETYRGALNAVLEKHGVILAYLYGSQARGEAGPLSDVDIAVLFAREVPQNERFDRLTHLIADVMAVFKRDDVYAYDLDKGTPLLNNEVRLEGVVLYCSDEEARVDFEVRAFRRFLDTEPLRRELNKYLREKIRLGLFGKPIPIRRAEVG